MDKKRAIRLNRLEVETLIRKQEMDPFDINFSSDENCILQYLNNFPDEFITEMEISRRADGRERFQQDSHWAHYALAQLVESKLVESDGEGRYRLCYRRPGLSGPVKKFLAPHIREILEQSGRKIDLSGYF
jgi:hypothetical protein